MVVECSSISLEGSAELREMLEKRASHYLAAPVSGNAKVDQGGQAVVRLLRARAAYDEAKPFLDAIGQRLSSSARASSRASSRSATTCSSAW